MNAEFQWWLLILGIVIGGALVYLVLADMRADDETQEWLGDDEPAWPGDLEPPEVDDDGRATGEPEPIESVRTTVADPPGG